MSTRKEVIMVSLRNLFAECSSVSFSHLEIVMKAQMCIITCGWLSVGRNGSHIQSNKTVRILERSV